MKNTLSLHKKVLTQKKIGLTASAISPILCMETY